MQFRSGWKWTVQEMSIVCGKLQLEIQRCWNRGEFDHRICSISYAKISDKKQFRNAGFLLTEVLIIEGKYSLNTNKIDDLRSFYWYNEVNFFLKFHRPWIMANTLLATKSQISKSNESLIYQKILMSRCGNRHTFRYIFQDNLTCR